MILDEKNELNASKMQLTALQCYKTFKVFSNDKVANYIFALIKLFQVKFKYLVQTIFLQIFKFFLLQFLKTTKDSFGTHGSVLPANSQHVGTLHSTVMFLMFW